MFVGRIHLVETQYTTNIMWVHVATRGCVCPLFESGKKISSQIICLSAIRSVGLILILNVEPNSCSIQHEEKV